MTDEAVKHASEASTVVMESNYDMDMLISGPYPHELEMRIRQGQYGHLSNDECAFAIKQFWHEGLRNIFLCHLSDHNNTPELAYSSAKAALTEIGVSEGSVHLCALPRTDSLTDDEHLMTNMRTFSKLTLAASLICSCNGVVYRMLRR